MIKAMNRCSAREMWRMLTQFNNPEVEIVNLMVATDNLEFIRDRNNVKSYL